MDYRMRGLLLAALLGGACGSRVSPSLVAWLPDVPTVTPAEAPKDAGDLGRLIVQTDRDETQIGSKYYYFVRRPYDLYTDDGRFLRRVENQGWRQGEEPQTITLSPGRYVIATQYGARYRKMQVEIRAGATTEVSEETLRAATLVFANDGA